MSEGGEILKGNDEEGERVLVVMQTKEEGHPYAFHVSGPRNVPSPNWRDLISSNWSVLLLLNFQTEKNIVFT